MKRNHTYFTLLLPAALYLLGAGCTAGLVEETVPEAARPIELRFDCPALGLPEETRTAGETTPLPEDSTVRIAAYRLGEIDAPMTESADFATTKPFAEATYRVAKNGALLPCKVDVNGRRTAETGAESLTVRSGIYDFYAVSPARPLAQVAASGNKWQISGIPHKEDVMTSFLRSAHITQATRQVSLKTFQRKCAQVVFTVAESKKNLVPMDTLRGLSLVLSALSTSGTRLEAGENAVISPTGGDDSAAGIVRFDSTEFVPVIGKEAEKMGLNKTLGVVLPKDGTPFRVAVTVQRDTSVVTLRAQVGTERQPILFEAGKRYIFTLEVENYLSRLYLNVIPWVQVPFTDNNVGGSDGSTPTDPVITPGTSLGFVVAEWKDIDWSGIVGDAEKNNNIE